MSIKESEVVGYAEEIDILTRPRGDVAIKVEGKNWVCDTVLLKGVMTSISTVRIYLANPRQSVRVTYLGATTFYKVVTDDDMKVFCDEEGKEFLELHED